MSTVTTEIRPRDVIRCRRCLLVQFRTVSDHCRRCTYPLPPVPRLEAVPKNGRLSLVPPRSSGPVLFSPDRNPQPDSFQPRGKTTRELTIGRKLRELREQRHLTQQDMAARAGVPRTYISRIENARLLPGPLMLGRIANALEVAILELLPQNKNGHGQPTALSALSVVEGGAVAGVEEPAFWNELVEQFSLLGPEEVSRVMFLARTMAEQTASHDFVPQLAAS